MHPDDTGSCTDPTMSKKDADLDKVANDIHLLFQSYNGLMVQNSHKETKIVDLTKQLQRSQEQEREAQNSIQQLHEMRDRLQSMLSKRCDLQDENKSLQEALCEKEKALQDERKKYEAQFEEVLKEMEVVKESHADEIASMQSVAETQRHKEAVLLERGLHEKTVEVKQLQKQLADAERDRHTEIVKLRLEYDAKLMKLQKESHTKAQKQQQNTKSSTASNALLRQKMLNEKAASTQEVNILKRTIADLQRELRATQHHDTGSKKRRY